MTTDTFAFIIHPISPKKDVGRRYPLLGKTLTEKQIDFLCTYWPPVYCSHVEGARSIDHSRELTGWLLATPYTPRRMLELPVNMVYNKIVKTGQMAERLGAKILGLGAFTAVVGDAGVTIAERLDIPVTTGDSYTVAISVQAMQEAARLMGIESRQATAAVVGATGAIGSISSQLLADKVGKLILIGRRERALEVVRERCEGGHAELKTSIDVQDIREADLILSVTSSIKTVIQPQHLKPGAIVYDAAVPPDVSRKVARERKDVLILQGGMVQVPGPVDFHFNFGFPRGKSYACMAETMALAMEGRYEDYTIGRDIEIARVYEIEEIATRHGFRLSGLRSFNRVLTPEHIARVREQAHDNRQAWHPVIT